MEQQSSWTLTYNHFDPTQEGLREALCTLGNGYFGTRGAAPESVSCNIHYPGTYCAGFFNKLATHIAGRTVWNEDLVNCPNWTFISFKIGNGEWFFPSASRILSFRQELDMKQGILTRRIRVQNMRGQRTLVETQRIVSMANAHIGAIKYTITPENYNGIVTFRTMLDGAVENSGVARYRQLNSKHLRPVALGRFSNNGVFLAMKTSQSKLQIALAEKIRVFVGTREIRARIRPVTRRLMQGKDRIGQEFKMFVQVKSSYSVEKTVAMYTSRDAGVKDPVAPAIESAQAAERSNELFSQQKKAWGNLWKKVDMQIDGDAFSQKVVRLHIFHLLQVGSPHSVNIDAGFPPRGLHGEAYRGHIFWDELYIYPFYDFHIPEIAKALLQYRYRRLPRARRYAKENGYKGSMFPWQSGSTGEEETQTLHLNPLSGKWGPDHSRIQRHVSFAIAYNVWRYWMTTQDLAYMKEYGAELLLSIAQFGASVARYKSKDKRYHTYGLMGPDEFHEKLPNARQSGLKDNAYSNVMIVWTLLRSQEMLALLPPQHRARVMKKLRITEKNLQRWDDITRKMHIMIKDDIIEQFDGYFKLKELDWKGYRAEYGNIHRMDRILKAEGKSPDAYKVAKQADVLMIFYLFATNEVTDLFKRLGYAMNQKIAKKNYDYYIKRTSHGSTLSKVVHCFVADRSGRLVEARRLFKEVLESDIHDTQGGTTPEGIHAGVMAGSLDIVMRTFAGIDMDGDIVSIAPRLPKDWRKLSLKFCYRHYWFDVSLTKSRLVLHIEHSRHGPKAIPVEIKGQLRACFPGKTYKISL